MAEEKPTNAEIIRDTKGEILRAASRLYSCSKYCGCGDGDLAKENADETFGDQLTVKEAELFVMGVIMVTVSMPAEVMQQYGKAAVEVASFLCCEAMSRSGLLTKEEIDQAVATFNATSRPLATLKTGKRTQ